MHSPPPGSATSRTSRRDCEMQRTLRPAGARGTSSSSPSRVMFPMKQLFWLYFRYIMPTVGKMVLPQGRVSLHPPPRNPSRCSPKARSSSASRLIADSPPANCTHRRHRHPAASLLEVRRRTVVHPSALSGRLTAPPPKSHATARSLALLAEGWCRGLSNHLTRRSAGLRFLSLPGLGAAEVGVHATRPAADSA